MFDLSEFKFIFLLFTKECIYEISYFFQTLSMHYEKIILNTQIYL